MTGTKLYGILATEKIDRAGERLLLDGMDTSQLNVIIDEHPENITSFAILGSINSHVIIRDRKECKTPQQQRCWDTALGPFLFIEGELADDFDHPNAKSAAALIKFASQPDIPLTMGFSVDGSTLQRTDDSGTPDEKGKVLARSVAKRAAITVDPANPQCLLFLENDLAKSSIGMAEPPEYKEALKKSWKSKSFIDRTDVELLDLMTRLKKSLSDYYSAWTAVKCYSCGKAQQFFKSGKVPNGCSHCGNHYSLSQIWAALNR